LLSRDVQAQWAAASGTLPVRADVADLLSQWFSAYPWYKTAYSQLILTKSEPPLPGYDFVRENIDNAVSAILEGGNAKEILDVLNETANSIIAEQTGQ
jgi:ABC-type glycerol-3-phosphate transport system substrate-binding protein